MAGMNEIAKAAGLHPDVVSQVFEAIADLVREDHVVVKNFGTFRVRRSPGRSIVSPQLPGGVAQVEERNKLFFKAAPLMNELLNGGVARARGTPGRPKKNARPSPVKKDKGISRMKPIAPQQPTDEDLAEMTPDEETDE